MHNYQLPIEEMDNKTSKKAVVNPLLQLIGQNNLAPSQLVKPNHHPKLLKKLMHHQLSSETLRI